MHTSHRLLRNASPKKVVHTNEFWQSFTLAHIIKRNLLPLCVCVCVFRVKFQSLECYKIKII